MNTWEISIAIERENFFAKNIGERDAEFMAYTAAKAREFRSTIAKTIKYDINYAHRFGSTLEPWCVY